MKKFAFVFTLFLFFAGVIEAALIKNGTYLVKYRFINFALSPTVGEHRYEVLIKDKKVIKVLDLTQGKYIPANKVFGLDVVLKVLEGKTKGLKVIYRRGKYKIKPLKSGYYRIFIDSITKVQKATQTSALTKVKKELSTNYYKWSRKKIKNYILRVQDSRFKTIYPEGVELVVKNGKIVEAKDIRSYKKIDINKEFLTVRKLFSIARWALRNNGSINYDPKFFYPSYIKTKDIEITASYLRVLR